MKRVGYFKNGLSYRNVDVEKSIELAKGGIENWCWVNAIVNMLIHDIDAVYVEGFQIYDDGTQHNWSHAWLEKDGVIIDGYPNIDWDTYDCVYFPAVRYPKSAATKLFKDSIFSGQPLPFSGHISSPNYKKYLKTRDTVREFMRSTHSITLPETLWS